MSVILRGRSWSVAAFANSRSMMAVMDNLRLSLHLPSKGNFIGLFLFLVSGPALPDAPALPDFVEDYIDFANSSYELPQGSFEEGTAAWLRENGQPEPRAVGADFNGDGVVDWAGLLRNEQKQLDLVVVYSYRKHYLHEVLSAAGADTDQIISGVFLEPPGLVEGFPLDESSRRPVLDLKHPGIYLVSFEKASVLFLLDRFRIRGFSDKLLRYSTNGTESAPQSSDYQPPIQSDRLFCCNYS